MQLADIERFAVDDCIILTNSKNFQGWNPHEIKTTVLSTHLPIPDDLEKLQQEKLPVIEKNYFNSSHYRLVSFTPSFSDLDQLEVTLAPLGFHEYYSITPFFDEPLLTALDGSKISIRQKYGNTALLIFQPLLTSSLAETYGILPRVCVSSNSSFIPTE